VEPDHLDEGEEELFLECPTCGEVTAHDVLRAAASGWTVQCLECSTPRTLPAPARVRTTRVPLILSQGSTARTETAEVPLDGPVAVGSELEAAGHRPDGTRPESAPGREVKVVYGVVFDTVALRYTVNQGEVTRSFVEEVPPEEEVHVGSVREVQGVNLVVKTLKSDQNRTLHRGFLLARSVRRVFADLAPAQARHGDRVRTRLRGAPSKQARRRGKA
jgi:uncharacterized Zn finger protein